MEKLVWLESEVQNKLDSIQKIIIDKESSRENDSIFIIPVNFAVESLFLLGMAFAEYNGAKDYFYSDSRFIGCGICEMVFLSGKIKMIDNKPVKIGSLQYLAQFGKNC